MTKTKRTKKPKSKRNLRQAKRRVAKAIKAMLKKIKVSKTIPSTVDDPESLDGIIITPLGLRSYDPKNPRFNGIHPEYFRLQEFQWLGLLTLKFYSYSYSKDDHKSRKNRMNFLCKFMENIRAKLGISDREFNWYACEEFGFTGMGHLHVLFSFDHLKEKNRMDKLKISDFSEEGHFFKEGRESVIFVSEKLDLNPGSVDLHWRPMWENEGLVNYFCKKEFGREDKSFDFSKFWEKRGLQKAA